MSSAATPRSHGWQIPSLEAMQAELPAFRFAQLLGRGGMGAVYQAVELSLGRAVAIKILPADLMEDAEAFFAERFEQEARTMARLNHPGVVRVFDSGLTAGGLLYFVMEYVDGTDLARLIAESGKLAPEQVLDVAEQICRALDAAHREGIIHRDIKPANILLSRDGQVKIADFGLAKHHDTAALSLTKSNVAIGTPDYVAPEAWTPGTVLDGRADLFAAGVVLYQMLTGVVPRGLWNQASAVAGVDVRFDTIIDKAMQPERDQRYATAADMLADIAAIRTAPAAPVVFTLRRNWRKGGAVGAAALVAVIAGVMFLQNPEKPSRLSTHVTTTADSGPGSLREAMENCDVNPGPDTVTFDASLSGKTIHLEDLQPRLALGDQPRVSARAREDATMTIDGTGVPGGLVISSKQGFYFHRGDAVSIRSITFTRLKDARRSSISNAGHLTFTDCTFASNSSGESGAAINNLDSGEIRFDRCTFTANSAVAGGGAIHNRGTLILTDCQFSGNRTGAGVGGALLHERGTATLTNCRFSENEASCGGALAIIAGTVTASRCTVVRNTTAAASNTPGGGGIYIRAGATVQLEACIVAENTGASGPDIWTDAGILKANDCWIGRAAGSGLTDGVNNNRAGSPAAPLLEKNAPPAPAAD